MTRRGAKQGGHYATYQLRTMCHVCFFKFKHMFFYKMPYAQHFLVEPGRYGDFQHFLLHRRVFEKLNFSQTGLTLPRLTARVWNNQRHSLAEHFHSYFYLSFLSSLPSLSVSFGYISATRRFTYFVFAFVEKTITHFQHASIGVVGSFVGICFSSST